MDTNKKSTITMQNLTSTMTDSQFTKASSDFNSTSGRTTIRTSKESVISSIERAPSDMSSNLLTDNTGQGLRIEDFNLLKVVGRGSFGKVYMARKKDTGRIYAVKTLKKDFIIRRNQVKNTKIERDIM